MILILHYYKSIIDGVMTSLLDLYNNLKLYRPDLDIDIRIICPELFYFHEKITILYPTVNLKKIKYFEYKEKTGVDLIEDKEYENLDDLCESENMFTSKIPFMQFNRNFGDITLHKKLTYPVKTFKADTIICSARLLYEIISGNYEVKLSCKKMFVLDSLDLFKTKLGIFPCLDDAIPTDNCTFLVNPATVTKTKFNQVIHYTKFSEKRLMCLPITFFALHDVLNYKRSEKEKIKIDEGKYAENMGKSIFEHLYHEKEVNYYTDGLYTDDGLMYYLQLFGIDGSKNHVPLKISREEIKEKLFVNIKDFIFKV